MDQYYMNDHLLLFLNDDKTVENKGVKICSFINNFSKTIHLNRPMECSLVKIHCPKAIYEYKQQTDLYVEMNINFISDRYIPPLTDGTPHMGLKQKPNYR